MMGHRKVSMVMGYRSEYKLLGVASTGAGPNWWNMTTTADAGQTLVLYERGRVEEIEVYCRKVGSPANGLLEIYATSGGAPTGGVLADAVMLASGIGVAAWRKFALATPVTLEAGTLYYVKMTGGTDASNSLDWGYESTNPYAGGQSFRNGAPVAANDMNLGLHGEPR